MCVFFLSCRFKRIRYCHTDFSEAGPGLSGLAKCLFGCEVDKNEQLSNWVRRPLRVAQVVYAALDANASVKIYLELRNRCQAQGVAWPPAAPQWHGPIWHKADSDKTRRTAQQKDEERPSADIGEVN